MGIGYRREGNVVKLVFVEGESCFQNGVMHKG